MISSKEEAAAQEFKKAAEELSRIAVQDGISVVQIRNLYERARSKVRADFEVYVKYQSARSDSRGRNILSNRFGEKVLSVTSKYQKQELITILKYAVMLYDYTKLSYSQGRMQDSITDDIKRRIEQAIRNKTATLGFAGMTMDHGQRGDVTIHVRLDRFYGNNRDLAIQLRNAIKGEVREMENTFLNVWIEQRR